MQGATDISEPDYPYPVRYWWLRRIGVLAAILLVLLIITRLAWGWDASRRLRAEIDAARARGEPVLAEDFRVPSIPDAENYVVAIRKALDVLDTTIDSPSSSAMEYENYPPFPAEWHAMANAAMSGQAPVVKLIENARGLNRYDWQIIPSPSHFNSRPWPYNKLRHLANLLSDNAVYVHLRGNDSDAIQFIVDTLQLGESLRTQPILVGNLVGIGIDSKALNCLQIIAPGLRSESIGAARHQIESLIGALLSKGPDRAIINAMHAERALGLDTLTSMRSRSFLLAPMYDLDAVRYAKLTQEVIRSVSDPALRIDPPTITRFSIKGVFATGDYTRYASSGGNALFRVAATHDRVIFDRRVAAVSLAMRLYQFDHGNRWPKTLDELVPRYLPDVPIDSLSPDRKPLIYLLSNNGTRPMIYSKGENGRDQRADFVMSPNPLYGWLTLPHFVDDQFRDLSRFVPTIIPPTTTPIRAEDDQSP